MPTETISNPLLQSPIIPYLLIFMVIYFLIIKPKKKDQEERQKMKSNLKKNDQIVTAGGMHGTIVLVKDKTVILRLES